MDRDVSRRKFVHGIEFLLAAFFWPVVDSKLCNWLVQKKKERRKKRRSFETTTKKLQHSLSGL
jgi:hypothetical protein